MTEADESRSGSLDCDAYTLCTWRTANLTLATDVGRSEHAQATVVDGKADILSFTMSCRLLCDALLLL